MPADFAISITLVFLNPLEMNISLPQLKISSFLFISDQPSRMNIFLFVHIKSHCLRAVNRLLVVELQQPSADVSHPAAELSKKLPIQDLSVQEPDIEDAIREVYARRSG